LINIQPDGTDERIAYRQTRTAISNHLAFRIRPLINSPARTKDAKNMPRAGSWYMNCRRFDRRRAVESCLNNQEVRT